MTDVLSERRCWHGTSPSWRRPTSRSRRVEERFRALVQHGSDLIGVINTDATIRYISPSLVAITGRDPSEALGRPFTERVHPDDVREVETLFRLLVSKPGSRRMWTYRVLRKDGGVRHLEAIATNLMDVPEVRGIVFNAARCH